MPHLTIEQAMQVADNLHDVANAFADFVISNQDMLSQKQKKELTANQRKILETANKLLDYASTLVFIDVETQMKQLDDINSTIQEKLEKLAEIQKVIEISASFLILAQAIISAQPTQIVSATGKVCSNLGIKITDFES